MPSRVSKSLVLAVASLTLVALAAAGSTFADGGPSAIRAVPPLALSTVISGASLSHTIPGGTSEALSQPDDLATLEGELWVVFQNNVGADGAASPSGTSRARSSSSLRTETCSASGISRDTQTVWRPTTGVAG